MKDLLSLKGIGVVSKLDSNEFEINYAYSQSMLRRGIFVEFYDIDFYIEDVEDSWRHETLVSVFFLSGRDSYDFTIYHNDGSACPINLYRVILDLVDIIDSSNEKNLIAHLKSITTAYYHSHDNHEEEAMLTVHRDAQRKVEEVLELIEIHRATNN